MATSDSILDKLKNRNIQIATALGLDPAETGTWFSVDLDAEFVEWNHSESGSTLVTRRLSSADMLHEAWRVIVAAEMAWRANFRAPGTVAIDD